ncbi:MAG: hypothetical protein Q9P44_06405 [Anaerolineae bacterium]|nr:hypothetical protein [Anaerolineae bacterium]
MSLTWKQRSIGVVGLLVVLFALLLELRPSAAPGIGPYQIMLLWFGIALAIVGFARLDSILFNLSLMILSLAVLIILLELAAPWLQRTLPVPQSMTLPDPLLGSRYRPNFSGHDARGWRNPSALETANIVAIGDSQTWGVNAAVDETWSAGLSDLTGLSVYNMARGGYGAVQYVQLAEEALELDPQTIVVALYFGNDIADAYRIVYSIDAYADMRELSPEDMAFEYDISREATRQLRQYWDFENRLIQQYTTPSLASRIRNDTALGQLLDGRNAWPNWINTQYDLNSVADTIAAEQDNFAWDMPIYYGADNITFFTPNYRWVALRQDDPRILEGLRITQISLSQIQRLTAANDIQFLLVLIPTKELVYADVMMRQDGSLSTDYERLVADETVMRQAIINFLDTESIAWVDSLSALQDRIGEALYLPSTDGHPAPLGYRVIAEIVAAAIDNR